MADEKSKVKYSKKKMAAQKGGAGGIWFMGFIGTFIYFLHFHSGTLWLVILAFIKAMFWPAYLVYYLLRSMNI